MCHLTTTLCSFSYYESPRKFGDMAAGGWFKNSFTEGTNKHKTSHKQQTETATYRLNKPRGQSSENGQEDLLVHRQFTLPIL